MSLPPSLGNLFPPIFWQKSALPSKLEMVKPNWEGRFVHLQPAWYQIKKVIRVVERAFATIAAILAAKTVYLVFALKVRLDAMTNHAKEFTIFTGTIAEFVYLMRNAFWKDPVFCTEQAEKVWEENDFANYQSPPQRHETESIQSLDNANREQLIQAFIKSISLPSGELICTFNELIRQYSQNLKELELDHLFIERILSAELSHLSYAKFKGRYGDCLRQPLIGGSPFLLTQSAIDFFKQRLIEELVLSKSNIDVALEDYEDDLQVFCLNSESLKKYLIEQKVLLVIDGSLSYLEFKTQIKSKQGNGLDVIANLAKSMGSTKEAFKQAFLRQTYPEMVKAEYKESCRILNISRKDIQRVLGKNLSYSLFKATHSLSPVTDHVLSERQKVKLAKNLKCLLIQAPYGEARPHLKDCHILGLNQKDILLNRWKEYSVQRILEEEKEAFFDAIENQVFSPEEWAEKVLEGTAHESIKTILNKYPELFELRILHGAQRALALRFEKEIHLISRLEELFANYPKNVFKYGLLTTHSAKLNSLILDYYLENPTRVYHNSIIEIESLNSIDKQLSRVLKRGKDIYQLLQVEYIKAKEDLQAKDKEAIQQAEEAKLAILYQATQAPEFKNAELHYQKKTKEVFACRETFDCYQKELRANQRKQIALNYKIRHLQTQSITWQKELHSLKETEPSKEIKRLNNEICTIENQRLKLAEPSLKGSAERLYANSQRDELRYKIEYLQGQLMEVDRIPNRMGDKQENLEQAKKELKSLEHSLEELNRQVEKIKTELNQLKENFENLNCLASQAAFALNCAEKERQKVEDQAREDYFSSLRQIEERCRKSLEELGVAFKVDVEDLDRQIVSSLQALRGRFS